MFLKKLLIVILLQFSYRKKININKIYCIRGKNLEKTTDFNGYSTWSEEQLDMKKNILKKGYNERPYILISKDNICIDGHHRLEVLKEINPDCYIKIKKNMLNWVIYFGLLKFNKLSKRSYA